jgi:hypothetical protein
MRGWAIEGVRSMLIALAPAKQTPMDRQGAVAK